MIRSSPALVLDVGVSGAFVEHYGLAQPGEKMPLSFRWQGEPIEFQCEVARSEVVRDPGGDGKSIVSHTGLHFLRADGQSQALLEEMIATSVGRILAARRANATPTDDSSAGRAILARIGEARRIRSRGFVRYRLKETTWWRMRSESPEQPADGFTVAAWEDEDEVATLCRTYELADEEGRRLIRLVAEISAKCAEEER